MMTDCNQENVCIERFRRIDEKLDEEHDAGKQILIEIRRLREGLFGNGKAGLIDEMRMDIQAARADISAVSCRLGEHIATPHEPGTTAAVQVAKWGGGTAVAFVLAVILAHVLGVEIPFFP